MIESLAQFRKRLIESLAEIGFAEPPKIEDSDVEGLPALLIDGGLYVHRPDGKWSVDLEVVYPGVRYYPDGSGEPPSSDYITKFFGDSGLAALAAVLRIYTERRLANVLEWFGEEDAADAVEATPEM